MYGSRLELDSWTCPSRAYSTEDGPFSVSPWIPEDASNHGIDFFRLEDLVSALGGTSTGASSECTRRNESPESLESNPAGLDIRDLDNDNEREEATILDADDASDTRHDVYVEGVEASLPSQSPSFQIRVFDPESTDHESSNEYSDETIESAAEQWSGKAQELSPITEEESTSADAMDIISADIKRRSSDTIVQSLPSSSTHGIRRVSTMSDYQRLKGRHKSPKLVAFKASPASPAMTTISVQPSEAKNIIATYAASVESSHNVGSPVRRTSQTFQSSVGSSQLIWEEPPSSSDSEITVLTGSGVDYLVADEIDEENVSSSPMERLKTKLKAWSWERELSESSPDSRSRSLPLSDSEERRHRRQSSDYIENPPGPPNTVRHSGQSSMINSDPQTPAELESLEDDEDNSVVELKTKGARWPVPVQHSSSSTASSGDYLAIPRRTASLPASRSMPEEEETCFPHRDSVDISHARIACDEIKDKRSQELIMNSRDSFIITKSRLEAKHPRSGRPITPPGGAITWSRFGGLSPIVDASPPGISLLEARKGKQKAGRIAIKKVELAETAEYALDEEHENEHERRRNQHEFGGSKKKKVELVESCMQRPDEHEDCPICEVHRPRWFEAEPREW